MIEIQIFFMTTVIHIPCFLQRIRLRLVSFRCSVQHVKPKCDRIGFLRSHIHADAFCQIFLFQLLMPTASQ